MDLLIGLLLAFPAQPPVAPQPRAVNPDIHNLIWTYTGPESSKTPVVNMQAKEGRIEVQWKSGEAAYSANAARAAVWDGVLKLVGTEKEPVVLTHGATKMTALRIDVVLATGEATVWGQGTIITPRTP